MNLLEHTVALWQHILVVLALVATNATTFYICKHRVEGLKAALLAKAVLLGSNPLEKRIADALAKAAPQTCSLVNGETLTLEGPNFRVQVQASNPTTLTVRSLNIT